MTSVVEERADEPVPVVLDAELVELALDLVDVPVAVVLELWDTLVDPLWNSDTLWLPEPLTVGAGTETEPVAVKVSVPTPATVADGVLTEPEPLRVSEPEPTTEGAGTLTEPVPESVSEPEPETVGA